MLVCTLVACLVWVSWSEKECPGAATGAGDLKTKGVLHKVIQTVHAQVTGSYPN